MKIDNKQKWTSVPSSYFLKYIKFIFNISNFGLEFLRILFIKIFFIWKYIKIIFFFIF